MKKLLTILLLCSPSFAATWFATTSTANMSAVTWRGTQGASCAGSGTTLTWASRAAGDVFDANGCTAITVDQDPGANGKVILTTDATNTSASSPYSCATATGPAHITADITATTNAVAVLTISGSSGVNCGLGQNGTTITVTAGSAASANGVSDTHTVSTVTHFANIVGGGNANAIGYSASGGSGVYVINGTATGAVGNGFNMSGTTSSLTITNCVGSDSGIGQGCVASNTGTITVTGNLIFGKRAGPASGPILYTPGATNCIMVPGAALWTTTPSTCVSSDGTHQQMPSDTQIKTLSNMLTGVTAGSYVGTNTGSAQNSGSAN